MKVCTCVMLFGIFAHTNSIARIRTKALRSVKPANKNVSDISNKEYSGHTKILDNVHKSIATETTASVKKKKHVFRAARTGTLTGFIQDAVNILNTYEDTAFEDFFHILDTEIRKYHYKDCKFSELTQNQDTRNLLGWALKIIGEESFSSTKANINKMADVMREETYGNDVKKLLDYINSLYTHTEHKFHRVLKELKHYRKMKSIKVHENLIKVIRNGVRDILFDHYTDLDRNTRRELKLRIEKFWKQYKKNLASSVEVNDSHKMNDAVSKSVISRINVSENVKNKDKDPDNYFKNYPQTNLRNKRGSKTKEKYYQQPQDKETEKDDSSSESEKQNSDSNTPDEISSGQSFDSSSNSIKQSQERHAKYNAERYMTLYTEQISYKPRTTKKTEIIPISVNEVTKKVTVPSRPTTTSTPRYSSEDESVGSTKVDVLRSNHIPYNIRQGISDPDHDTESVSKQSQERHSEYNAERYMTLYTEQIFYKPRSTKKTEIIPISANEVTKKVTVPSRTTTTSTLRYSSEDESVGSKKVDVLRSNHIPYDIKQGISDSDHDTENVSKQSQERHAEYNSERYMTLYTEKMSYESRTTKKTEIKPISANEITKQGTVPRRPTTTSTPRYSSKDEQKNTKKVEVLSTGQDFDDKKQDISESRNVTKSALMVKSKPVLRTRQDDDKRQKHGKSKSKSNYKNTHFIGEYNAVIDVQLANTELLKYLGIFQPVPDSKYDTISYQRSDKQTKSVPTRPKIQFRRMRAGAKTKSIKPALTKPPSGHSKTQEYIYLNRLNNTRRNELTLLPEDDNFIRKQKQKYLTKQIATGLNVPKNFNEYVIKRLNTLEQDLKDFRSMLNDNHTYAVEVNNVTDKYEAKNKIENKRKDMKYNVVSLKIENHDLNKEENNDGQNTRSNMNTESSTQYTSPNPNVAMENTINTAVIDNKNTSQVTSNNVSNNKELNKDKIDNSETTVTVNGSVKHIYLSSIEIEPFETTPATTTVKPTPIDYANIRYQLSHINDGLDLNM